MDYYFKATNQAYSKEQIQGLVGIDPETTDDEVLNFYGIYRIRNQSYERDVFRADEKEYKIDGLHAYPVQSSKTLPLEEAKEEARLLASNNFEEKLTALSESFGLSPKLSWAIALSNSDLFKDFRESLLEITVDFENKLKAIEKASNNEQLYQVFLIS